MKLEVFIAISFAFSFASGEVGEFCDKNEVEGGCDKTEYEDTLRNMKSRLDKVRELCGEVCNTKDEGGPGKYYNFVRKEVNCRSLFEIETLDFSPEFPERPPEQIPDFLLEEFTHHGKVKVRHRFRDDSKAEHHKKTWTPHLVDSKVKQARDGGLIGGYGLDVTRDIQRHLKEKMKVKGTKALVLGSETPWLEALLLEAGVSNITTLDYVPITSKHPRISTLTPRAMAKKYLSGEEEGDFDIMVSFSSLEHSGLGRYGDPLNPWGDLISMSQSWCLLRQGGTALVGVPSSGPQGDTIAFNEARLYGTKMHAQLFANFEQIFTANDYSVHFSDCPGCYQPLHLVRKAETEKTEL